MKKKMNFIYRLLLFSILSINALAQDSWIQQTSGTQFNLYSVYFTNENNGWAGGAGPVFGSGILMNTTNGGSQWFHSNITNIAIGEFKFIDENTGWMSGTGYNSGQILKTTDNGINWTVQLNLVYNSFSSFSLVDENIVYASGADFNTSVPKTVLYRTSNGGANWYNTFPQYPYYEEGLRSVCFVNQSLGWATGAGENGKLWQTTNGGSGYNWNVQYTFSNTYLIEVSFLDENIGWVLAIDAIHNKPKLLKSYNGGSNWMHIYFDTVTVNYGRDMFILDVNTGWIVGDNGLILKTTNGGINWVVQNSGTSEHLMSIHFIDEYIGWTVGFHGTILHTTDGGVTFVEEKRIDKKLEDFSLLQNYPNPFNPVTKIKFTISSDVKGEMSNVKLKVYDALVNEVAMLVNEQKQVGTYEVEFNATGLTSGIYFYQLKAGTFVETKKMILLK